MLGSIIGDIIGSIYEFDEMKNYNFSPLFDENCSFTDDSILTCAIAEWLIKDHLHTESVLEGSLLKYCRFYPRPMGGYGCSFQKWLFNPELLYDSNMNNYHIPAKRKPYYSCGNGSAMRVSPVGWVENSITDVMETAKRSAEITHNHPEGIKGAQAVALCVYFARIGKEKSYIKAYIENEFGYDLSMPIAEIRERYSWRGIDELGDGGLCQQSVPQAISCALQSDGFEDAVRNAISIGGDSDTIGCITGGIAEALYGIPTEIMGYAIEMYLPYRLKVILKNFAHKYSLQQIENYFEFHPLSNLLSEKGKKFEI